MSASARRSNNEALPNVNELDDWLIALLSGRFGWFR